MPDTKPVKGCKRTSLFLFSVSMIVLMLISGTCADAEIDGNQESPIVNKCCPHGTEFNVESDECIPPNMEIQFGNNQTDVDNGDKLTASISSQEYLLLPQRLIKKLSDNSNLTSSTDFKFRLEQFLPNKTSSCAAGSFMVHVSIGGVGENETEDASTLFTETGILKYKNEYFSKPEFCLSGSNGKRLSVRICRPTCSGTTPCIRKCCDLNQVWNQVRGKGKQKCSPAGKNTWTPVFHKTPKIKATDSEINAIHPHYQIIHPKEWCDRSHSPVVFRPTGSAIKFRVLLNGDLIQSISRYDWDDAVRDPQYYCLDGIINPLDLPQTSPDDTEYSGNGEVDSMLFDCSPPLLEEKSKSQSILYGVVLIFSSVFLLLTIAMYILLWEKQNVHGWTLMCYAVSLFFMYMFFVMLHFSQLTFVQGLKGHIGHFCYFIGVGLNYFFVSTFCWMSMVNFDLWCTLKAWKPVGGNSKGFKRFLGYTAFSIGVPTTIVTVAIVLDYLYIDDYESDIIVPEYGRKRCNLDPQYAQLAYAYGPAGVLLAFNLIIFISSMYTMCRIQQSSDSVKGSSSKAKQLKQSVQLFAKLLLVMGIPWIFEVISWADERHSVGTSWYWLIFDLINILQGLAIFIILVCRRDVIHALEQKYPKFKALLNRVLLNPEKAERISRRYPWLKGIIKPFTRDSDASGNIQTDASYTASPDIGKQDIKMQTKIYTNK